MKRLILAATLWAMAGVSANAGVQAACTGRNLFDDLTPAMRAEVASAASRVPHSEGTVWEARKGDARMLILGTYHFTDPRHADAVAALKPRIENAATLMVEVSPEDQEKLKARLLSEPDLLMDPVGPSLPERMGKEQWAALSEAAAERGVPAILASRMRPWYAAMTLSMSPCMIAEMRAPDGAPAGMDMMLMDTAEKVGVPVRSLEPYDTVLGMFDDLSPEDEIDMVLWSLPGAEHADDFTTTTAAAFFAGKVWELWEFSRLDSYINSGLSRAEVDRQVALAQERLMDRRNRAWIAPLTAAAEAAAGAAVKPGAGDTPAGREVVAAVGALHLPGEQGVLRLLERDGWTVERVAR